MQSNETQKNKVVANLVRATGYSVSECQKIVEYVDLQGSAIFEDMRNSVERELPEKLQMVAMQLLLHNMIAASKDVMNSIADMAIQSLVANVFGKKLGIDPNQINVVFVDDEGEIK